MTTRGQDDTTELKAVLTRFSSPKKNAFSLNPLPLPLRTWRTLRDTLKAFSRRSVSQQEIQRRPSCDTIL